MEIKYISNSNSKLEGFKMINKEVLKDLLKLKREMGYISGKWEQNDMCRNDFVGEQICLVRNLAKKYDYELKFDNSYLDEEEFDEIICENDFWNCKINDDNLYSADEISADMSSELENYLINILEG